MTARIEQRAAVLEQQRRNLAERILLADRVGRIGRIGCRSIFDLAIEAEQLMAIRTLRPKGDRGPDT